MVIIKMDKKEKKKSIFQTIRDVNQKEIDEQMKAAEEEKNKIESEEAKIREEYEQELKNDRLELLKMKQGISHEEIKKEEQEKKKYTFFQKIENFMYLYKTYVILGAVILFMVVFLTVDVLKREEPDVALMVVTNDNRFEITYNEFKELCENNMTIDVNEDGEITFSSYYMPLDPEVNDKVNGANSTKLYALLQGNETMLMICDSSVDSGLLDIVKFEDLSVLFPDNSHVDGFKFMLKDTKLIKDLGFDSIDPSCYLALRKVSDNLKPSEKEKMQKYYDSALELLKAIVTQYS